MLILVIICMSAFSIFWQTSTVIEGAEKEKDKKSTMCLKDFKENDCNVYSPTEKCKPIIECIKDVDEPFAQELKNFAEAGYQQIEKLSIVPLVIIGLVILNRRA